MLTNIRNSYLNTIKCSKRSYNWTQLVIALNYLHSIFVPQEEQAGYDCGYYKRNDSNQYL